MFELSKDKDELISSQKALIDGMHKVDADINSTRKKLGDSRDLIIHKDAELDKCKMEIIKLSENSTSPDGRLELEHQLEDEKDANNDLVKKLRDQILITKKTKLAFNTQNELVNAKNEIVENHKVHAMNGVILNGLLLWADIQRKVTPENNWKAKAVKKLAKRLLNQRNCYGE